MHLQRLGQVELFGASVEHSAPAAPHDVQFYT